MLAVRTAMTDAVTVAVPLSANEFDCVTKTLVVVLVSVPASDIVLPSHVTAPLPVI